MRPPAFVSRGLCPPNRKTGPDQADPVFVRWKLAIELVIFDLDGTLADSLTGIANSLNRALGSFSLPEHLTMGNVILVRLLHISSRYSVIGSMAPTVPLWILRSVTIRPNFWIFSKPHYFGYWWKSFSYRWFHEMERLWGVFEVTCSYSADSMKE